MAFTCDKGLEVYHSSACETRGINKIVALVVLLDEPDLVVALILSQPFAKAIFGVISTNRSSSLLPFCIL